MLRAAENSKGTASYFGEATFNICDLIRLGASVNAVDEIQETPLMRAALCGNLETVETLIAAGAAVNAKNEFGQTPFFYSLRRLEPLVSVRLLRAGAEIDLKNIWTRKSLEDVELLYGSAKTVGEIAKFSDLTNAGNRLVLAVAAATLDVEASDNIGNTPLMALAAIGDVENILTLRKRGANFNTTNKKGETALMLAKTEETAGQLLKFGAKDLRPSTAVEAERAARVAVAQNGCVIS